MSVGMKKLSTIVGLILVAALSRLIPHPWNFTAIGAMALFGGAQLPSRWTSLVVPMAALFLSDMILGLHSGMIFVYLGFAMIVMLGWMLREGQGLTRLTTMSLVASCVFFLVSNFGVWVMGDLYPVTGSGLISCYVSAIPFFGNQIFGDLFFTGVLFGGFELAKKIVPELSRA
jgi:hypothetical protein